MTLSQIETEINAGLSARGITWAVANSWQKALDNGRTIRRIYLKIGTMSDGFVEVAEDGALSIPAKGQGTCISRPALARAVKDIVAGLMVQRTI